MILKTNQTKYQLTKKAEEMILKLILKI